MDQAAQKEYQAEKDLLDVAVQILMLIICFH